MAKLGWQLQMFKCPARSGFDDLQLQGSTDAVLMQY